MKLKLLIKVFPELKEEFEDFTSWQDGWAAGAILTFENVFFPFIETSFKNNEEDNINRIINFIEENLDTDSEYQINTFVIGIIEPIWYSDFKEQFMKKALPKTLKYFEKFENYKS